MAQPTPMPIPPQGVPPQVLQPGMQQDPPLQIPINPTPPGFPPPQPNPIYPPNRSSTQHEPTSNKHHRHLPNTQTILLRTLRSRLQLSKLYASIPENSSSRSYTSSTERSTSTTKSRDDQKRKRSWERKPKLPLRPSLTEKRPPLNRKTSLWPSNITPNQLIWLSPDHHGNLQLCPVTRRV